MKKNLFTALLILSVLFTTGCTKAQELKLSKNVKTMIKYAQENNAAKANALYKSFNDSEIKEFTQYIEKNPGTLPPLYFVVIADEVYKTDKDKAVFFYNFGKIRALEDVKMCKDTSARQQIMFYGMMAPNTLSYMQSKATETNYVSEIYNNIIKWDNKYTNRVSPIWACYHGIQSFNGKPELLPASEFPKIKSEIHKDLETAAETIKTMAEKQKSTQ